MQGFGDKNQSKKKIISNENRKFNSDQLIKKAFQLQAQGKKLEAAKYYLYLIKNGLKDYRVFSNYGTFLKEIGKYKEAELELTKAIKLNPRYAFAYYNLAGLLLEKGNFPKAETYLRKAIELKSDFSSAHYNLGIVYQKNKNFDIALESYRKAARLSHGGVQKWLKDGGYYW